MKAKTDNRYAPLRNAAVGTVISGVFLCILLVMQNQGGTWQTVICMLALTSFFLSILLSLLYAVNRNKQPARQPEKEPEPQADPEPVRLNPSLLVRDLKQCTVQIQSTEMKKQLNEILSLISQLEDVRKNSETDQTSVINLYQSTLPQLVSILKSFIPLQAADGSSQLTSSEERLSAILTSVTQALNQTIQNLRSDQFASLSADLSALNGILNQSGLSSQDPIQKSMEKHS